MISLGVIGFGNHVNKNILPALNKIDDICIEAIYVRNVEKYAQAGAEHFLKIKSIELLTSSEADWIYVSTPIASHYQYVKQALLLGKNVICEKPLTDSFEKTQKLFNLAAEYKCKLHEVCMYTHHKQYEYLQALVGKLGDEIKSVHVKFSIPHLEKTDIRYQKKHSGGALLDVGYYPISIMVNLFGMPRSIQSIKKSEYGYEVDLRGSAILDYESFYCTAEWGIGVPYSNQLTIESNDRSFTFSRIFSKPPTLKSIVEVTKGFDSELIEIGEDDQFVNMFLEIIRYKTDTDNLTIQNTLDINKLLGKV